MQKQAPTLGRLLTMVLFALSCFGLLLFLWLAFGGPIPLKPKGYRFEVAVPEANQLAIEADVRVARRRRRQDPRSSARRRRGNKTIVTIELDRKFAPLDADARVIQRSKTILGEKYLEITPRHAGRRRSSPRAARLPDAAVEDTVELDEVLGILDKPTRSALPHAGSRSIGEASANRGESTSTTRSATCRASPPSGTDVLEVLDQQEDAIRGLVRNTGVMFGALTEREDQLRNLVVNTDEVFDATAQQQEALAETFADLPDVPRRVARDDGRPRVVLAPGAPARARPAPGDRRTSRPTLRDVRALAPDLERLLPRPRPADHRRRSAACPRCARCSTGAKPLLGQLQPFLEELNPILEWLEYHQHTIADFFANGGGALVDTVRGPAHRRRSAATTSASSASPARSRSSLRPERGPRTRGNAYLDPTMHRSATRTSERLMICRLGLLEHGKPGGRAHDAEGRHQRRARRAGTKPLPGPDALPAHHRRPTTRRGSDGARDAAARAQPRARDGAGRRRPADLRRDHAGSCSASPRPAYLVLSLLGILGGLVAGLEHEGALEGFYRGLLGGLLFGTGDPPRARASLDEEPKAAPARPRGPPDRHHRGLRRRARRARRLARMRTREAARRLALDGGRAGRGGRAARLEHERRRGCVALERQPRARAARAERLDPRALRCR